MNSVITAAVGMAFVFMTGYEGGFSVAESLLLTVCGGVLVIFG